MAVDGTWNLTMQTPMGDRKATLVLTSSGGKLEGTQSAEGNSADIFEGAADGDSVSWKVRITDPMPMTLEFSGSVGGDAISGNMKAGSFGSWPFSGQRG